MKRHTAAGKLLVAGAVSFVFLGLVQGHPEKESPDYTIRSDVRLVLLDVSVQGREHGLVSGLSKDNFAVFENGKRQRITTFDDKDLPVTVGILVDESFSMRPKRADVLSAALTFIEKSNPQDEVFILNFNDRVTRGLPSHTLFSDNVEQLRSALHRGIPEGKTALYDAVVTGLSQLGQGRRVRKALVVISDGGDNASERSRREMLELVESSIATIYAIGLYDAEDPDRNPGVLRELAKISGGESYFPQNSAGMTTICSRIAKDIRSRYTIGYTPQALKGATALRRIRVQVTAPGYVRLNVHTRSSYRYDSASNEKK